MLTSERVKQLLLIKGSPRYLSRLSTALQQKAGAEAKLRRCCHNFKFSICNLVSPSSSCSAFATFFQILKLQPHRVILVFSFHNCHVLSSRREPYPGRCKESSLVEGLD